MIELTRKRIIAIVAGVLVLAVIVYGFWPDPTSVQVATVVRDSLQVTVEEEGETRMTERYEVSSPVAAFARRIEVEAGDVVAQGEPLVQLEAPRASILDVRSRAEAEAAAEQAERQADAAEAAAERAREERQRVEQLVEQGSATQQVLEQAVFEERRVTAVASIVSPSVQWTRLGSGYRVLARFIVWQGDDVLQAPSSALFRTEEGEWAVFVVEDGRARRRAVRVGHQSGLTVQIISGLEEGEAVIVHPDNELEDGARVEPRNP